MNSVMKNNLENMNAKVESNAHKILESNEEWMLKKNYFSASPNH